MTELDFLEKKIFCPKKLQNGTKMGQKQGFFEIYQITWSLIFTEFVLQWNFLFIAVFLRKSHIWENFCF